MVFKKIRLVSWLTKAFLSRHGKIIIAGFVVGIGGFFLFSRLAPYLPQPKPHEKIARIGQYRADELPEEVISLLSIGLTTIAEDGSAAPGLAENWYITDDQLTYNFVLRDNLFWQDKTPVKAEEINYQFSDVQQEIVDERTIRFKLKEPFSPLPTILSQPVFKDGYLGVGPYQLKRIKKRGSWIEEVALTGPEKNLTFRFYPTEKTALLAFKLGEVDIFDNFLTNPLEEEWQNQVEVKTEIAHDEYLGLFFNTQQPLLSDKSNRQGLAYAIKEKPQGELRASGPINPQSWAYNPETKLYLYDPKRARELFKGEDEEIKIATSQSFLPIAEEIKKSWTEVLGLKVEVEIISALSRDFQVFLGLQKIPPDPDQYIFWHSTREENLTQLKNVKIDKILEDGRKSVDREKRKEKYFDFQQTLSEESPVVFLSHPTIYQIKRKEIFTWF